MSNTNYGNDTDSYSYYTDTSATPEIRLWLAIILQALTEYQEWLHRIQQQWLLHGEPVDGTYANTLRRVRYECEHEWFKHVCDLADISHDAFMRKLIDFEKTFGLCNVRFTDVGGEIMSAYSEKLIKRKRIMHDC
jgi:hypothetical protein